MLSFFNNGWSSDIYFSSFYLINSVDFYNCLFRSICGIHGCRQRELVDQME